PTSSPDAPSAHTISVFEQVSETTRTTTPVCHVARAWSSVQRKSPVGSLRTMTDPEARRSERPETAWSLTSVAYAAYYLGRKAFSVAKKPIEHEYHIGRGELAAIDTGHLALYAIGQVLSGLLADRIGARRLVGFGMLLSSAACIGFGASKTALAM